MSGMMQLHEGHSPERRDLRGQTSEAGNVVVGERAELSDESLTAFLYVGGTGHHHAETTFGSLHQPVLLVVGQRSIGVTLHVGEWGQHESVRRGRTVQE